MKYAAKRTAVIYNHHLFQPLSTEGVWDIPSLRKINLCPDRLIPFHQAISFRGDTTQTAVHFFIDDYLFERVWNRPEAYLENLKRFQAVLTPDWSMYLDFPAALILWNQYRKQLIGQFLQNHGCKVIPTVSWGFANSFDFCFQGIPKNGTIAVATAPAKSEVYRKFWIAGMNEAVKRIQPQRVILYGENVDFEWNGIETITFFPEHIQRMRDQKGNGKKKKVGPRTKWLMENEEAVMNIARRFGIPRQDQEDFRQETLLRSLTCQDDYQKEKASIQTWAGNFTAFIARNWLKKRNAENKTKSVDFRDSDASSSFGQRAERTRREEGVRMAERNSVFA